MGKNKKVFLEAVSDMKHFLLGSALVLTLVTVVPALAQFGGAPPGGGSAPSGGGAPIGGSAPTNQSQPSGGLTGGSQPTGGTQPSGGFTGGSQQGGQQIGGQQGGQQMGGQQGGQQQGGQQQFGQQQGGGQQGGQSQFGQQQGGGQQQGQSQFGQQQQGGQQQGGQQMGGQQGGQGMQKGIPEKCPQGETGTPPFCSGAMQGGQKGLSGSSSEGSFPGKGATKGVFPGQGKGVEGGFPGQGKGVQGGFSSKESSFGEEEESGSMRKGQGSTKSNFDFGDTGSTKFPSFDEFTQKSGSKKAQPFDASSFFKESKGKATAPSVNVPKLDFSDVSEPDAAAENVSTIDQGAITPILDALVKASGKKDPAKVKISSKFKNNAIAALVSTQADMCKSFEESGDSKECKGLYKTLLKDLKRAKTADDFMTSLSDFRDELKQLAGTDEEDDFSTDDTSF